MRASSKDALSLTFLKSFLKIDLSNNGGIAWMLAWLQLIATFYIASGMGFFFKKNPPRMGNSLKPLLESNRDFVEGGRGRAESLACEFTRLLLRAYLQKRLAEFLDPPTAEWWVFGPFSLNPPPRDSRTAAAGSEAVTPGRDLRGDRGRRRRFPRTQAAEPERG